MKKKRYTGIVIGCGRIGATFDIDSGLLKPASHAAAFATNPRTTLAALVDSDPIQLKRAGEYYNVTTYADARECLKALMPDIVALATPPGTHEEMLTLALELHIPAIICEKPLSDTLESGERMVAQAALSDSVVVLNHQRRFLPLYKNAKERIAAGELGDIQQATAYYTNGLLNNATHTLDALQFLLDDTAVWTIGVQNEHNTAAPFGTNIDGLVGYKKGTVAVLQSFDTNSYGVHDLQILGTKGALIIRQQGFRFEWVPVREGVTFSGVKELDWMSAQTQTDPRSMMEGTIAHAVECLDGTVESQSTPEDGYRTMQILDALVRSAAEGGKRVII